MRNVYELSAVLHVVKTLVIQNECWSEISEILIVDKYSIFIKTVHFCSGAIKPKK